MNVRVSEFTNVEGMRNAFSHFTCAFMDVQRIRILYVSLNVRVYMSIVCTHQYVRVYALVRICVYERVCLGVCV